MEEKYKSARDITCPFCGGKANYVGKGTFEGDKYICNDCKKEFGY